MKKYIIIKNPPDDILKYLDMKNTLYLKYNKLYDPELNDPLKYNIYPPKIRSRL